MNKVQLKQTEIGEIPKGWRSTTLSGIAQLFDNKRIPLNSRERGSKKGIYPYYGASGIVDYLNEYIFDGEYVLISEDGENLRTRQTPIAFIANGKFWVNNHAHIILGTGPLMNNFITYAFQNMDVNPYITGAVQPKLNQDNLLSIPVIVPPENERQKIVQVLKAFDDSIGLNHQLNKTLESMGQALFKKCFSEESDSRRKGAVADVALLSREAINPSDFSGEIFDHYSIPAFDERRLPKKEVGESIQSNKFIVPSNAILLSKLNPRIPRIWFPSVRLNCRSVCSTEFLVAIPQPGITAEYLYGLFSSQPFIDSFTSLVTGTSGSHQRVKPDDLLAMKLTIPPLDDIARFSTLVKPLYQCMAQNIEKSSILAMIRDSLLPKLMSGRIRVEVS